MKVLDLTCTVCRVVGDETGFLCLRSLRDEPEALVLVTSKNIASSTSKPLGPWL